MYDFSARKFWGPYSLKPLKLTKVNHRPKQHESMQQQLHMNYLRKLKSPQFQTSHNEKACISTRAVLRRPKSMAGVGDQQINNIN
jgi:hypothetical protein